MYDKNLMHCVIFMQDFYKHREFCHRRGFHRAWAYTHLNIRHRRLWWDLIFLSNLRLRFFYNALQNKTFKRDEVIMPISSFIESLSLNILTRVYGYCFLYFPCNISIYCCKKVFCTRITDCDLTENWYILISKIRFIIASVNKQKSKPKSKRGKSMRKGEKVKKTF